MLADRISAGNLQTKGTARKWGEAARERAEAHQSWHPLTSATQRRGRQEAWGALRLHQGFLEKELHRRYSKRELHDNKRSVLCLKSQRCIVVYEKKKKRKMTKHKTSIWHFCSWTVPKGTAGGWHRLFNTYCWDFFSDKHWLSSLERAKRKVTNLLQR